MNFYQLTLQAKTASLQLRLLPFQLSASHSDIFIYYVPQHMYYSFRCISTFNYVAHSTVTSCYNKLAFITAYVFTFLEMFTFSYSFSYCQMFFYFNLHDFLENYLHGSSSGNKLPQILFSGNDLISPSLLKKFCQIMGFLADSFSFYYIIKNFYYSIIKLILLNYYILLLYH